MARYTGIFKKVLGLGKTHRNTVSLSILNLAGDRRADYLKQPTDRFYGKPYQSINKYDIAGVMARMHKLLTQLEEALENNDLQARDEAIKQFNKDMRKILELIGFKTSLVSYIVRETGYGEWIFMIESVSNPKYIDKDIELSYNEEGDIQSVRITNYTQDYEVEFTITVEYNPEGYPERVYLEELGVEILLSYEFDEAGRLTRLTATYTHENMREEVQFIWDGDLISMIKIRWSTT